jgi:hypothetical protein
MRVRCASTKGYVDRGITVCPRWQESFENFLADMGERPEGMTLDRIDNDKGYSPENCRWATKQQQVRNTRSNVRITYEGRTQTMTEWAEELGIKISTLQYHIASRMPLERAMTPGPIQHRPRGSRPSKKSTRKIVSE